MAVGLVLFLFNAITLTMQPNRTTNVLKHRWGIFIKYAAIKKQQQIDMQYSILF